MTGPGKRSGGHSGASVRGGRLRTVLLASAAAALPLVALALAPAPVAASAPGAFLPSSEPMVLTRQLRRPLPGGIEISTARSYEVRFVREEGGYRIEGKLIEVEIKAPARFEALAALERARPDTGMFPMRIDASGRFLAADGRQQQEFARSAGQVASGMIPAGLVSAEARDARAFIGQSSANPVQTAWPEDLFRPVPGKHSSSQVMSLPGGKTGEVAISTEAQVDAASGLVTSFRREVTTRLGDSTRVTLESWTLAPKG